MRLYPHSFADCQSCCGDSRGKALAIFNVMELQPMYWTGSCYKGFALSTPPLGDISVHVSGVTKLNSPFLFCTRMREGQKGTRADQRGSEFFLR